MKAKKTIPLVIMLLIAAAALAVGPHPFITVFFDFPINITAGSPVYIANITNTTNEIPLANPHLSADKKVLSFEPATVLSEGAYTFSITAKGINNIWGPVVEEGFTVARRDINITLISPEFGVSSYSPFNLTIETDAAAECRYGYLYPVYSSLPFAFNTTGMILHSQPGFSQEGALYVGCKDDFDEIYYKRYIILVDNSKPNIVYHHADDVFEYEDPIQKILKTVLVVQTDEDSVCRYHRLANQGYENMSDFDDENELQEDAYSLIHTKNLTDLMDGRVNNYYVRCKNKAGLVSDEAQISFNVNTNAPSTLTINYPTRYVADQTPSLNITTNRNSLCRYSENSDMGSSVDLPPPTRIGNYYEHIYPAIGTFTNGTYTYHAECVFSIGGTIKQAFTFTLDTTPPEMLYVNTTSPLNDSSVTYRTDQLCGEWEAYDDESGVDLYEYHIIEEESDEIIAQDITSSTDGCEGGLALNDSHEYYFAVRARNSLGLWSENMSSSLIKVDISKTPVSCSNDLKDGDETDIDCGGSCESCSEGRNCSIDSDCLSEFCNASNKCQPESCNDGRKNGDETDIDCGGSCPDCSIGDDCDDDSDCDSRNCDSSTKKCVEQRDSCTNSRLDPDETDIDCGGNCQRCSVGRKCDTDDDCVLSAECKAVSGIKKCVLRTVDSDGDGVIDGQDNCPNNANPDQADSDGDGHGDACDSDSDNDGLPDSFEQQYFDCKTCADPNQDFDEDGLTNKEEYQSGTNPTKADTDSDGFSDSEELYEGTDPLDPASKPSKSKPFRMIMIILLVLALAGGAAFLIYKYGGDLFKKEKPMPPPTSPSQPLHPAKPSPKMPYLARKRRPKKKTEERKDIFGAFSEKKPTSKAPEPKEAKKEPQEKEKTAKKEPKKKTKKAKKKKTEVFSKLKKITEENAKKGAFEKLSKISPKKKKDIDTVKEKLKGV